MLHVYVILCLAFPTFFFGAVLNSRGCLLQYNVLLAVLLLLCSSSSARCATRRGLGYYLRSEEQCVRMMLWDNREKVTQIIRNGKQQRSVLSETTEGIY
ncbi:hypothetical protein GGR56DRAFT_327470 [Xylariaceae sp. FL0804]|nr:hypothetical protein GGR56DRAFT_327470 [Xylariaceae sp. FL0804]